MSTTATTSQPSQHIQLADELSIAGLASRAGSRTAPVGPGTVKYLLTIGDTRFGLPARENTIRMREGDTWSCYVRGTGNSQNVHCYGGDSQQYELPAFDVQPSEDGRVMISVIPFKAYHVSPNTAAIRQVLIEDQDITCMSGAGRSPIKLKCLPPDTDTFLLNHSRLFPRNELYETYDASAINESSLWVKEDTRLIIALSEKAKHPRSTCIQLPGLEYTTDL